MKAAWSDEPRVNFHGRFRDVDDLPVNPKPVQRPHPPIMIGGRSGKLLRVVAEHADLWNIPGGDLDDAKARSALLDRCCADIGRDPASIARSIFLPVAYDQPGVTRAEISRVIEAGFEHIILGLADPYPDGVAQWVVDELIARSL
jgi:alkanesulfonate monooxygenase SsuD/methylene tetrahydromethanopterin reductase-like flavin-dependent oxidoreductase (luciferase family)